MSPEEKKMWIGIQGKDPKAFENYYKTNYRFFFLLACKYIQDSSLAQEIVNDVFFKIWLNSDKIRIEVSLKSYICRAVVNSSINALNKNKKDLPYQLELNGNTDIAMN